ncbi:MAG: glycine--tRNA ligase subunit alpha/beta [Anaerolineaceae bacterium]|nr:glycine--tRNA ligase subunit alpha/beta [Anaerolineaceae bacterium]
MAKALTFQEVIFKLNEFWAAQDCVLWNPYNIQVGAGTNNPATLLRVLGPEPWRVAYVEPSIRPDDGRYGENPNRMQMFYQYQVILKPDPGNPQELYLNSLRALGLNPEEQDIRFVEDNWESPALGAWGLGWEVWLNGQEITQYTYFQQAGGLELNPVSVEITYGIERIVLALQGKDAVWDIDWLGDLTYGDVYLQSEVEHCRYYFELADVDGLKQTYNFYESESKRALQAGALIPAYDYILKCSHLFNVLDTRGAIGVTERASYFRRMRNQTREVAQAFAAQREEMGYPIKNRQWETPLLTALPASPEPLTQPADFLLEIGVEELPAGDVDDALAQLQAGAARFFEDLRLSNEGVQVYATPRRLVVQAQKLAPRQPDVEQIEKGPPANRAFDADGKPTKAAEGFARGKGVSVDDLRVEQVDGGDYVVALVKTAGRPATDVLAEALPGFVGSITFGKSMRWNASGISFSRPIRWLLALLGKAVIPFEYAGVASGNVTRGARQYGSPQREILDAAHYMKHIDDQNIMLDHASRRDDIIKQVQALAADVGGRIPDNPGLLAEVTNLVEVPTALRGSFDPKYLELPRDVLVTVMRKHQRYFAVEDEAGKLLPYFIAVRNGDDHQIANVVSGNEHVLRARFSDANYFYKEDIRKPLEEYLPRLSTLTFQEKLGSMLDKNQRVSSLVESVGNQIGLAATVVAVAQRAAHLAKADLATQMVVEMTSLQGTMGREYALLSGYPEEVADSIFEHWQPRGADDALPASLPGALLALTDRLDSLVGLFGVGLAPKSTADPYGLRRAALGIIQIMVDRQWDYDLSGLVDLVAGAQPVPVSDEARKQVLEFISGRLQVWLADQGWAADVLAAVLAEQSTNPYRALVGTQQLSEWIKRPDWEPLLDSFARCVRITRSETQQYDIDAAAFAEAQEQALYAAYQKAASGLDASGNVDAFLTAFEPMVPAVTAFFDHVMVNVDDEHLRQNRLALLQAIGNMQTGRADLSQLSGF